MGPLHRLKKLISLKKKKKLRAKAEAQRRASGEDVQVTRADKIHSERLSTGLTLQHEIMNTENNRKRHAVLLMSATIEVLSIVKEASEATSVLAPLKTLCFALSKLLELSTAKILDELDVGTLFDRLEAHSRLLEAEREDIQQREKRNLVYAPNPVLLEALEAYLRTLGAIKTLTEDLYRAKHGETPLAPVKSENGTVIELEVEVDTHFGAFLRQVQSCILETAINTSQQVSQAYLSQMLQGAVDARGDRVRPIASGTRLALIERLSSWALSKESADQVFWLQDKAGTGKSALAAHMARQWHMEGVLAGRFFFNQNGGRNFRRLDRFCVTLTQELSENYPAAKDLIIQAMTEHSTQAAFKETFEILLTSVVERISKHLDKPLIFVIDALDECAEDDVQLLLATLLSGPSSADRVRFFLTSRPTNEMTATLDAVTKVSGKGVVLLDVKNGDAVRDQDVTVFVRRTLNAFSVAEQDIVIECAKGVFLWATLACDTLQRTVTPTNVLRKLRSNTPHGHMATLYEMVLDAALPQNSTSRELQLMRSVLQGVTLTYMPISIFSIQSFFPKQKNLEVDGQEYVEFFVKKLGSIMKDGTPHLPIYLLHPTFKEFIETQKQDARFYISPPAGHNNIAIACLDLLSGLTRNVLGLYSPDSPIPLYSSSKHKLPARLSLDTEAPFRYALTFWATHAALALGEDDALGERVNSFLESSFLAWVEWSSALKELSETIEGIRLLRQSARVRAALTASEITSVTEKWCMDSLRFLQRNSHTISNCGLQAWMSALVFTPKRSIVYQTFHHVSIRPLPEVLTHHADNFDNHRILDDAGHGIYVAAVSPDGKRLLSHEGFGTFRLWNMKSLKIISTMQHNQSSGRMEADFSSDGSLIASGGGDDAEIYLWDGFSGKRKERLLPQLHSDMLIDIAFALSDRVIISIAKDSRIICWNVAPTERWIPRGKLMRGEKHSARMTKLAVSSDGKLVATFSIDYTVRLWSTERRESVGIPMIGNDGALSGAFSVDGTKLVAGYENGEVIVWDVATQALIHRLPLDEKRVYNVTVSPDGRTIASGNLRLSLWDINTGTLLCPPLVENIGGVGRLAFSRDGSRLVSGSQDQKVRVWDIRRYEPKVNVSCYVLNGHTRYINGIFLSSDGRWITSASEDGTIRVWDTELHDASDINEPFDFTHDNVRHLALSGDGSRLLSAGTNGTLQIWDASSGKKSGDLLQSGQGDIKILLFSRSNDLWASGHITGDVCLWQSEDDNVNPTQSILSCQQGSLKYMAFLPDNSCIATGGNDQFVQIWDIATRTCKARLDCSSNLRQIAISHDGTQLASYSVDGNIRLWDLSSCLIIAGPTAVHSQDFYGVMEMDHMVFSPDGKTIATSYGYLLRLLDVDSNLQSFTSLLKRTRTLDDLTNPIPAFSADGKYVFYEHHILHLAALRRNEHLTDWPPHEKEACTFNPISPLFISPRWTNICSIRWSAPLLVAPADMKIDEWVAHDNVLAFGTTDGRVFILRFPKEYI